MSTTTSAPDERSWWKLGDDWRPILKRTMAQFKDDAVPVLAAAVTLRIVLSLVPALIAAVAIAAQFVSPGDIERLVSAADEFVPPQSREFVTDILNDSVESLSQGSVPIIAILAGLFAASSAAVMLMKALNDAYGVEEGRGLVGQRLVSLGIVGALALTLIGVFVALVVGPSLLRFLLPEQILESPIRYLITVGRYAAAIVVLAAFFGFTFWLAPNRDKPARHLLTPGAAFGVVGWLLLSYLFSLYVRIAGDFAVYGAAAGVFILLIWLNYSFTVLLMGAELDSEIERHITGRRSAGPEAGGGSGTPGADAIDLDAVDEGMLRHPGLVGAGARIAAAPRPDPGPAAPRPRVSGAAARTGGVLLAARFWDRLGR
jgi:membrane protein